MGLLVGWLVSWLVGWGVGWLLGCWVVWLLGCLVADLLGCLGAWLVGCLVGWLLGCVVGWLVSWLVGCLGAWLVGWLGWALCLECSCLTSCCALARTESWLQGCSGWGLGLLARGLVPVGGAPATPGCILSHSLPPVSCFAGSGPSVTSAAPWDGWGVG